MSAPAAMAEELEAAWQKRRRKKHREQTEVAAVSSESPRPPATPDSKPGSSAPVAPETLTSTAVAAGKERKRKKHREQTEVAAASSESPRPPATPHSKPESSAPVATETLTSTAVAAGKERKRKKKEVAAASPLVVEAMREEEKNKRKRSKHEEAAATSSPSTTAAAASQILKVAAERAMVMKERRRGKAEQGQSSLPPLPVDDHPQGGEAAAHGGVSGSQSVKRSSGGKPRVFSNREILRMRIIELRKQQPMPRSFVPAMANPNSIDQDPKYSSPFGAFFDQFCYKPDRRQGRNAPSLPETPDRPARLPPRDHPSYLSCQLTANKTMSAKTTTSTTKQPHSASASGPQEEVKVEQGQSGQLPLPVDVHPQGGEAAADGGVSGSQSVKRSRSCKPRVLSDREIPRMRIIELRKQQPQGFVPDMSNPNSIDQDSKYSSPFGAFFDQFCYKPDRQQGRNTPSLPKTPDRPARPPPRDHPSYLSSRLTANKTMAAKTTTSTTKQPHSASASGTQEEVNVKEKKKPEKNMSRIKKPRKPPPSLSTAEKRSDKYRRLPLNQLVCPPRSPHKLLQEKYAHDPWKVIVICILLNLTQGKQVRKKVKGFFKRYPDAHAAYTADPEKMAEYLAPLGLQYVKAERIQKFSMAYVGEEWTYITELCGVGKYAADAYAIFCAGRATEVVPEDHKLVDYWKYVCFELPLIKASQNAQEAAGVTRHGNFAPEVQQIAVSC